jgi:hypothetical protein
MIEVRERSVEVNESSLSHKVGLSHPEGRDNASAKGPEDL